MGKLRKACANCIKYKLACEAKRPCARCILHQCDCIDVERKPRTVKKKGIKRSRYDTVESLSSMCFPPAQPISSSPEQQASPPFVPDLVDLDPFAALENSTRGNNLVLQSTEASVVPAADYGYVFNNNLLSMLTPPTIVDSYFTTEELIDSPPLKPLKVPTYVTTPVVPTTHPALSPTTPVAPMNPVTKITLPFPQPLLVVEKRGCKILDCNAELAQFLGYNSIADFNEKAHALEDVLVTDESRPFDFTPIKIGQFEKLATVKSVDTQHNMGVGRPVIFNVAVMQNLVIFTVKEAFEIKQLCSYSRWLKMMMPNAIVTPSCEQANCQCKYFDLILNSNPQMVKSVSGVGAE